MNEQQNTTHARGEAGFRETLKSDFRQEDFAKNIKRDWDEVVEFFMTDERREELRAMHPVKKIFVVPFWLFRAMYLHLTPARRILLLIGIVISFVQVRAGDGSVSDGHLLGVLLLLFILLLELKDKILARDELEAGRAVQMALMPDACPRFAGWDIWIHTLPANDVGGDLVDSIPIDAHTLGLSLGDVAGKGLGAALFMAKLQATLRALAPGRASIAALGTRLSEIFDRDGLPNRFTSLVYLEVTDDSGEITLLNAGHMPPLHIVGDTITELPRGGPALGILKQATYGEQRVRLGTGEVLLVYSDGLTEAQNAAGDFFGEDRLRRLLVRMQGLDASRMGEHILERVRRFTGDARQHDDLSLMILRKLEWPAETTPQESSGAV
ncbi:MAG: PP2C family protein-serine/threonine phosphatase [Bacteroidota bacterium]|nr:PP2C family protein-serine/threonine phosphatase [Bacteroidota bacterium]